MGFERQVEAFSLWRGESDPWRLMCFYLPFSWLPKDGRAQKFKYCQQLVMLKVLLSCQLHAVSSSAVTDEKYAFRIYWQPNEANVPKWLSQTYHFLPRSFFFWRVNHRIKKHEGCKVFHLTYVSLILDYLFCSAGKKYRAYFYLLSMDPTASPENALFLVVL